MSIDLPYISAFLSKVEGPRQTTGYIPCFLKAGGSANYKGGPNPERYTAMGSSGVTIATGCDLGQTDYKTLTGYGLDPSIAAIFNPYFGKKKDAAIRLLHERPLVISSANALALDLAVHGGYLSRYVIPAYEQDSRSSFASLPKQAQAVIMSICFQKGVGGTRRGAPITWKHLCNHDWAAASHELIHGFRDYAGRRKAEGRLLLEICQ